MKASVSLVLLVCCYWAFPQFVDVTESKQFHQAKALPFYGAGVSAADYDQDGDIDLFVCTGRGYPNQLYQNANGSFTSISETVGLGSLARSRMALWIDIDGDHDLDLLVAGDCDADPEDCLAASETNLFLYQQDNGVFEEITEVVGLTAYGPKTRLERLGGLAAADINNDSFLDIVLTTANRHLEVFVNDGAGNFIEQSVQLGFENEGFDYWQPFFHDFDRDGNIDLYCNVDFDENQLWMNDGFSFVERSRVTNSNSAFNEMGVAFGDVDSDGDFDIYATNITNYEGEDVHNILLRHEQNIAGDFFFSEVARELGIDQAGWDWGTTFFDADNNGLLDLATTNGWTGEPDDQSKIWMQQPDRSFTDQSQELGFNDVLNGVSLISFDYDRDGDLDMVQTLKGFEEERVPFRLLENQFPLENLGHSLVVKPRMQGSNRFAIGATVTAYTAGIPFSRLIHAGTSFYGQEPAEAFIGLGPYALVDSLSITWPGGEISWWFDLDADQVLVLEDTEVVHRPGQFTVASSNQGASLTWTDQSANEEGFRLQKSATSEFLNYTEVLLPQNSETYLAPWDLGETASYFRIQAYKGEITSRFSDILTVENPVLSVRDQGDKFRFHPNPTSRFLKVQTAGEIYSIHLFAMDGSEVSLNSVYLDSKNTALIDLKGHSPGVYVLRVNTSSQRIVLR